MSGLPQNVRKFKPLCIAGNRRELPNADSATILMGEVALQQHETIVAPEHPISDKKVGTPKAPRSNARRALAVCGASARAAARAASGHAAAPPIILMTSHLLHVISAWGDVHQWFFLWRLTMRPLYG